MNDMIPVEVLIGVDDEGDFWVRMLNMEDPRDVMEQGPFNTQEEAEEWATFYMEEQGGIHMGRMDDTKH